MQFRYKVIDEGSMIKGGTIEAIDLESAKRRLIDNNWQIVTLNEVEQFENILTKKFEGKVKIEAIAAFSSQLSMIIRSGVSMIRGLEILLSQMEDRRLKAVISTLHQDVSGGNTLGQAMKNCQGALPELFVNLVSAGEESGNLDSVLSSMSSYYERENFIRKKITSAAIYPIILTVVLIGLVILFMTFILPQITDLVGQNGQSLPASTQMIVDSANFLKANGLFLSLGLALFVLTLRNLFKIPKYKYMRDAFLLSIPVLGKNNQNIIIARLTRTFALFLRSSIPILTIFDSLENIVSNEVARKAIVQARDHIIGGETLHEAFEKEKFFGPLVTQMLAIGEETGRLEELLEEVANHYDKLVEVGITRMVALVEPAFTLIIGIFAGGLIISIALPIFSMSTGMQ